MNEMPDHDCAECGGPFGAHAEVCSQYEEYGHVGAPKLHAPRYVFRDGADPVAFQAWVGPCEDSIVLCSSCAETPREREFPLYPDDLDAAKPTCGCCAVACERCEKVWHGGPEFVVYIEPENDECTCGVVLGSHDSTCPCYPEEVGRVL